MSFPCELAAFAEYQIPMPAKKQRTLKRSADASGIGVFSGQEVKITLCPNEQQTGIVFKRVDLPHQPEIAARLENVQATPRCTVLGDGKATIQTVEHLLSALRAYEIDNALIKISGSEVPIFDGSASAFVSLIEKAGICELQADKKVVKISKPLFWSQGGIHLIAIPSHEFRISYTLHYPHSTAIGAQYYSFALSPECFKSEIAPSRTFSVYEEIAPMIEKGLVKGGNLTNAIIVKENKILNPEGLRFADEMVRHKVLDLIGDLSLVPIPFLAHIIAVKAGHSSNNAFANELYHQIKRECS
ncbi:MAG TPA: UDP-3-O-acyl-N-acetylglucosamine deacetylase [Rhabdochlamydiaceae bacterium]